MKDIGVIRDTYGVRIARKALEMEAISLKPQEPFQWASGYRMPIYNDNRRLLADPGARELVAEAFAALIGALSIEVDDIAGTATAGIPHATTLADLLANLFVRALLGKDHGLKNQIEGGCQRFLPPASGAADRGSDQHRRFLDQGGPGDQGGTGRGLVLPRDLHLRDASIGRRVRRARSCVHAARAARL